LEVRANSNAILPENNGMTRLSLNPKRVLVTPDNHAEITANRFIKPEFQGLVVRATTSLVEAIPIWG
jgi:hypothetical protein